jgi:hypothetical protein
LPSEDSRDSPETGSNAVFSTFSRAIVPREISVFSSLAVSSNPSSGVVETRWFDLSDRDKFSAAIASCPRPKFNTREKQTSFSREPVNRGLVRKKLARQEP